MDRIKKRQSRGLCLQLLFANNFSENTFNELLSNFFILDEDNKETIKVKSKSIKSNKSSSDIIDSKAEKELTTEKNKFNKDQIKYAERLYLSVLKEQKKIDKLIEAKLVNWEMSRLAIMDRMILRMSICEMLFFDDIPPKVSITEAVEIAKEFSSKDSSGFVNGIMDAVYNEHCVPK